MAHAVALAIALLAAAGFAVAAYTALSRLQLVQERQPGAGGGWSKSDTFAVTDAFLWAVSCMAPPAALLSFVDAQFGLPASLWWALLLVIGLASAVPLQLYRRWTASARTPRESVQSRDTATGGRHVGA